jgi:hypothetical protein
MLKVLISFLFFVFLNPLFAGDLLIVNGTNYCVVGFQFSSTEDNDTVTQKINYAYYYTSDTLRGKTLTAVNSIFTNNTNVKLYLDMGSDCSEPLDNKEDVMPLILEELSTNITNGTQLNTGHYANDYSITVKTIFPNIFSNLFQSDLDTYQLNFLYGLSGLICATFLLFRIS